MENDYLKLNKDSWNKRTSAHLESDFYALESFKKGKSSLNAIELELLGDVSGLSILHLQCHFGQDSLSLARMGANVTGVDLSDKAINAAKELNSELGLNAEFVCCDVYEAPNFIDRKFDLVFTSYGTIGWLPNLNKWARVVGHFLKPGGRFVMADFHPVIWMYDDDLERIAYRYAGGEEIREECKGTYADEGADIQYECVSWNHSISSILNNLIDQGITIEQFNEFDHSPYNVFPGTVEVEPGKFRVEKFGDKIPLIYSILGKKGV